MRTGESSYFRSCRITETPFLFDTITSRRPSPFMSWTTNCVPMPLSAGVLASLSAAVANGHGGGDLGELAKFVRESMVQNFD